MPAAVPTISVILPSYNPQERILSRVLEAVALLCTSADAATECVIVDNRSDPPLEDRACVRDFVRRVPGARVIREERQGLTFARLAGIRNTSGDVLVVFDDDNVPGPDYLRVVRECVDQFPRVGVWGPGTIDVELLDPVRARRQQRVKELHNQRREHSIQFGCIPASWQPFYPIGMGQAIRREVADAYRQSVETGALSATDRSGGGLTGGGDNQIVWQAVAMGFGAGVHPALSMRHLIPGNRTTVKYLTRLAFGCGASYLPCFAQSFPEARAALGAPPTTAQQALELARFVAARVARGRVQFLSVDFANLLGLTCGRLAVEGRPDHWTFKLARRLGLS